MELILLFLSAFVVVLVVLISKSFKGSHAATPAASDKSTEELIAESYRLVALIEVRRQAQMYGDAATVAAVDDMTYDGPLPDKRPDGTYTSVYELHDYNIAGINYRDGIAAYVGDFDGYLQPDQTNEHDPNAIAIFHKDGHHLGFIPAACIDHIRALGRPFPMPITGNIEQEHDDIENRYYFVGTVYIYALKK
ncbi:MAG: HIRAN domain-containing protein [Paludibacteraceae bacterium]|nr:HIRAN domain-containing protein [Paludibacteraceae bacterium]